MVVSALLEGRRVIITGGASGMGGAMVGAFPAMGARVASMDIHAVDGARIVEDAGAAAFFQVDVTSEASVIAAMQAAVGALGGLDVLIHAAGVAPFAAAAETSLDFWNHAMAVNATGTFLTNRAAYPYLRAHGGTILNFASAADVKGHPGKAAYAAAKGAVLAWTRTIAVEWGREGVRANAVAPAIWTPMYDQTRAAMDEDQLAAHDAVKAQTIPFGGRLGDVTRDFVPVLAFLASDGARFINGQVIAIDGGMLMVR